MTLPTSKPPEPRECECGHVGSGFLHDEETHRRALMKMCSACRNFEYTDHPGPGERGLEEALRDHHALLAAREARIGEPEAERESARKWALCYLNHIVQTEDRDTWTEWDFVTQMANDIHADFDGSNFRLREARKALGTKGG